MKAKAGFLMLLIGLVCFTGFGFTTPDLAENSTTDMIQMDHSGNVVAAPVMDVAFVPFQMEAPENKYLDAAVTAAIKTDIELSYKFRALFNQADDPFNKEYGEQINKLLDVGWNINYSKSLAPNNIKDTGGELSIFYI